MQKTSIRHPTHNRTLYRWK